MLLQGKQQAARLLVLQQAACFGKLPRPEEIDDFLEWGILYGDGGGTMPYNPAVLEEVAKTGILATG